MMIMNTLGTPKEEDINDMNLPNNPKLPKVNAKSLAVVLKECDPNAIDLISKLLRFSP